MHAFARALSMVGLYAEGHPAREGTLDEVHEGLQELLEEFEECTFSFIGGAVVYGERPLKELRDWSQAERLSRKQIQRIRITRGADRSELGGFTAEVARLLASQKALPDADPRQFKNIWYGPASMFDEEPVEETPFDLYEQAQMADGLYEEALNSGRISGALARAVLNSLSGAMRSNEQTLLPLVPHEDDKRYVTVRSMNTSVLGMALGEFVQLDEEEIEIIGEAALLHDVGEVVIPAEILNKPGELDPEEWEIVKRHPVEGARILLRSGVEFELAALAAYEHHLSLNGEGYPELVYPRKPHRISQVVRLCDAYDAMRTKRTYQEALSSEAIIRVLQEGAGTKFAPDLVEAFVQMINEWSSRIVAAAAGENHL
jgi:hypothetical protein